MLSEPCLGLVECGPSRAARLPALPEPDEHGNYPAIEYARASLARKIILRREALGWSQAELVRRADIRVETLWRIETGKVTPSVPSADKVDRALRKAEAGHPRCAGATAAELPHCAAIAAAYAGRLRGTFSSDFWPGRAAPPWKPSHRMGWRDLRCVARMSLDRVFVVAP